MSNLPQLVLRPATLQDSRRIWEWRNEMATRQASFHVDIIEYAAHESWFQHKLAEASIHIFIVVHASGNELGYVRFDIQSNTASISVSIDPQYRSKHYGTQVIRMGSEHMMATVPIARIDSFIRCENKVSRRAFEAAGYALVGITTIRGIQAYHMAYTGQRHA